MRTLKKTLALVLVLAMMFSLCITASAYTDDAEIEYADAVELLSLLGVIEGYPDGSFGPEKNLNRAEAAIIIAKLNGYFDKTAATPTYTDMAGYGWANWAVAYAENEGIVNGTAEGIYEPGTTLTGYMWVKMLAVSMGINAEEAGMTGAAWQIGVTKVNKELGLTAGIEDMDLAAPITREQAAQCAYNALFAARDGYTFAVDHVDHIHYFRNVEDALLFAATHDYTSEPYTGWWETTLGYEVFGLEGYAAGENAWGQPFFGWYLVDEGFISKDWVPATATWTEEMTAAEFFADCTAAGVGIWEDDATEDYILATEVWANGVEQEDILLAKKNGTNCLFGNGTQTYLYELPWGNRVVTIEQFIGQVTASYPAVEATGADAFVVVETYCDADQHTTYKFFNSDLELGEVILFNVCDGEMVNVKTPETVTGTVLKIEDMDTACEHDDVYTVSGVEKKLSKHEYVTVNGGETSVWYVDDCGNLMMKAASVPFQYKVGFLLSYDAQNEYNGDKLHTCEKYEASEVYEIYDYNSGEVLTLNGALTVKGGKTIFATGAEVENTLPTNADALDLNGTAYNVSKAGISTGLVIYLTNEAGEIFYISDTQSYDGSLKIRTVDNVTVDVNNVYLNKGNTYAQNDDTDYVYASIETAHAVLETRTGLKNAKQGLKGEALTLPGEFLYVNATKAVLAVAQFEQTVFVEEEKPVVEDVLVYAGGDYAVNVKEYYTVDAFGQASDPHYEYVVTGLYIDGVKQAPIKFKDKMPTFEAGTLYNVTITTTSKEITWEITGVVERGTIGVVTYIGLNGGEYFMIDKAQFHMAEGATIVCVNDADMVLGTNASLAELAAINGKIVACYVVYDANGFVTDLYYWVDTTL